MSAQLHQIETSPDLVERVYRALLDAICTGALRPGQRVMQEELAEQLAVSRQPVMQALRLLRKDGFVRDAPLISGPSARTRGLQVCPLDADLIAQVYQVRGALDLLAVRLAAAQRVRIDPAIFEAGRLAVERAEIKAMIDADAAFHTAIYAAAGNPLIAQTAQLHWQHIRRAMGVALQSYQIRKPVWEEHEAIAAAIADGDAMRATQLMSEHTGKAASALTALMTQPESAAATAATDQLRGRRQLL
ncbi:MAG: GntR family transcriptional regulator [Hydrogenophaga sp.]|uniref:GntR family transcriptional regulator n=1 Tax=Hydrogenophaga sp. TaxID=1904254 RepID=UPI001DA216FB|nr:GntR family transcriptional regulator [Hydrogenophaga sp.]MBX3610009.1 GntR family transcriptional regulator [Hydrogenophaga sp.]